MLILLQLHVPDTSGPWLAALRGGPPLATASSRTLPMSTATQSAWLRPSVITSPPSPPAAPHLSAVSTSCTYSPAVSASRPQSTASPPATHCPVSIVVSTSRAQFTAVSASYPPAHCRIRQSPTVHCRVHSSPFRPPRLFFPPSPLSPPCHEPCLVGSACCLHSRVFRRHAHQQSALNKATLSPSPVTSPLPR